MAGARTFTLVRHGRTTYNTLGLLNGDPQVAVELDETGLGQCRVLRDELAGRHFDLAVRTRFQRTAQSLAIVLAGRSVPIVEYPEFDDVRLGIFESGPVGPYRAWRRAHPVEEPPPGEGESRVDALYRYARGYERLLAEEDADRVLVVIHDVPIRFMLNAIQDADPLSGPIKAVENAVPHELTAEDVERGLAAMRDRLGL